MTDTKGRAKQERRDPGSGRRPAREFQMKNREFVGRVEKNSIETVKVHVSKYQGEVYVDVRVFINDALGPGGMIATKKGLCLRPETVKALLPILSEAQSKAEKARPREDSDD